MLGISKCWALHYISPGKLLPHWPPGRGGGWQVQKSYKNLPETYYIQKLFLESGMLRNLLRAVYNF